MVMLAVFVAVGYSTGTHLRPLAQDLLEFFGFAPRHLWSLEWGSLITSALVTDGARSFWGGLFVMAFAVGLVEWREGHLWAATGFWGVHFLTLLILSFLFVLPFHLLGYSLGSKLAFALDVGPSAGYFGCLGVATAGTSKSTRLWIGLITCGLLVALVFLNLEAKYSIPSRIHADLAHAIAYPLGFGLHSLQHGKTPKRSG